MRAECGGTVTWPYEHKRVEDKARVLPCAPLASSCSISRSCSASSSLIEPRGPRSPVLLLLLGAASSLLASAPSCC